MSVSKSERILNLFFVLINSKRPIPRHEIRQIYTDTCMDTFKEELGIEQLTIAYSRPNTIGQIVAKAKLHQAPNREVSKYLAGELH